MIKSVFYNDRDRLVGFRVTGHSGYSMLGTDIVCAAVSSAVLMTANTITDIIRIKADVNSSDGDVSLQMSYDEAYQCQILLEGLKLHVEELARQYPKNLTIETKSL